MKETYLYFIFILISVKMDLFAQNKNKDHYNYQVREEEGDLNNDGKMDKITVEMDTINETRPLRLQIFLSQPNGRKLTLAVSSTKIIEPQYPVENQGKHNEYQIPNFFIENGILSMWSEIKGGNITYDFKYRKGNFELINVKKFIINGTKEYIDESTIFTETNFDLISGLRIETDEQSGSKKALKKRNKVVLIRPLPKIPDMKFSDKKLY